RALLSGIVHVHDAKASRVPATPFEVVEQRPREIAFHRSAFSHRLADRMQVASEAFDAQWIIDDAVDRRGRIVETGSVFGDVKRNVTIAFFHPDENAPERIGKDFPPGFHMGVTGLEDFRRTNWNAALVVARNAASVVVDTKEIELLLDQLHVVAGPVLPRIAEHLAQFVWIAAMHDGIEILTVHVRIGSRGPGDVFGRIGCSVLRLEIHDESDLTLAVVLVGAKRLDAPALRAKKVV